MCTVGVQLHQCAVLMTVVFPAVVSVTAKSHSSQHQHISTGENKSFRLLLMTLMSVCVCSEVSKDPFKMFQYHENLIFYAGLSEGKE